MRRVLGPTWSALVGVAASLVRPAEAQAPTPKAAAPPSYQVLRYAEDWSVLAKRDPKAPRDPFDPIKYVPLSRDGSFWMSFGGQARVRGEAWRNFNFGAAPAGTPVDGEFGLLRVFAHADLHLGRHVRVFAEGKSALVTERRLAGGKRTIDEDRLDLQNGFVELSFPAGADARLLFRGGRQELLLGKQRLVSPLDWVNTRRTFEGFVSELRARAVTVTAFFTRPVDVRPTAFNRRNDDVDFYGLYATYRKGELVADLYGLGLERPAAVFNGTSGAERRATLGGRFQARTASRVDLDVEGAYQLGEVGAADVSAFMVASQLGFTPSASPRAARLYVGFDYASGDRRRGDGRVGTFNQLFPLGHAYFGHVDAVGRQNVVDLSAGLQLKPAAPVTVSLDAHRFALARADDALYNAAGAVLRAGAPGRSKDVGTELDLVLRWRVDRHLQLEAGGGRLFAGAFLRETGSAEDIGFAYLTFQYTF